MVYNHKVSEKCENSTQILLYSIIFYQECLFSLWETSHHHGIEDGILASSIIKNLDDFSQFIRLVNRKNEDCERFERRILNPKHEIQWAEKFIERIYDFYHCLSITECQKNRLFLILGNLMNEIKHLRCFSKSYDNDRSTIWVAKWVLSTKN